MSRLFDMHQYQCKYVQVQKIGKCTSIIYGALQKKMTVIIIGTVH